MYLHYHCKIIPKLSFGMKSVISFWIQEVTHDLSNAIAQSKKRTLVSTRDDKFISWVINKQEYFLGEN